MSLLSHSLYESEVMHRRYTPMSYRFKYGVFSLMVNIDRLGHLSKHSWLLSYNRFNAFSFHEKDHGDRDGSSLRKWVNKQLSSQNINPNNTQVMLHCFPRVFGYTFNPLSLWYVFRDEKIIAVICEVSNTFGESHSYFLHDGGAALSLPVQASKKKIFHVSPFMDMDMFYHFTITKPEETLSIVINEYQNDEKILVATQSGQRKTLNSQRLLWFLIKYPLLTMKVMFLIHWNALKIWIKGGKFHRKPLLPEQEIS